METTTSNVLVQGQTQIKERSLNTHPHTLTPPYHQEKPELEDVGKNIADKTVRDTAKGTIENTLNSTVEKIFVNTFMGPRQEHI